MVILGLAFGVVASCDDEATGTSTPTTHVYDVEVTLHTLYEQPAIQPCVNAIGRQEATLRFHMPAREYSTDGCGGEVDGKLHVLCGSELVTMEVVSDVNGASWSTDTVDGSNAFLSVFRYQGKTWLDLRFSATSSTYEDPGCSGEQTSTSLYIVSALFAEDGQEFIPFDEIDLSLGLEKAWSDTAVSEDQCGGGCFATEEVEVRFVPVP